MNNEHFFIVWKKMLVDNNVFFYVENFICQNVNLTSIKIEQSYSETIGRTCEIKENSIGIFESLEEINRYCFHLAQELNLKEVVLVSIDQLNTAVEKNFEKGKLLLDLYKLGEKLNNPEFDKKNIFSKFFS